MNVSENRQRMANLRYIHGGISQQKGNKEHPEAGDMAPVVYSSVEDSLFQIVLIHCKLFSTFSSTVPSVATSVAVTVFAWGGDRIGDHRWANGGDRWAMVGNRRAVDERSPKVGYRS